MKTIRFIPRISISCALLALGCPSQAQADTQVCGTIVGGHWTLSGSPYRVTCDTYVVSLTVDPGVSVLVQSNCVFEVDGVLTAVGTAAQPIYFTRAGFGGWRGISFNYSLPGSQLSYCVVSYSAGRGIRIEGNGVPAMQNCTIASNSEGGIAAFSVSGVDLVLQSCTVANNSASGPGGGVYADLSGGDVVLRNCTVSKNSSGNNGGGGIRVHTTSTNRLYLEGCTIAGNSAAYPGIGGYGGGIAASGNVLMRNCLVTTNTCTASGTGYTAAGVWARGSTFAAYNCVFSGNVAGNGSAGAAIWTDSPGMVSNCSFAHNGPGSVRVAAGINLSVVNSIFWALYGGGGHISGTTDVTYCNVQGGFSGQGNTSLNPIFTDQTTLTLLAGSPCIDAGSPNPANNDTCFPPSQGGVRNDMGAYGGPSACDWPAVQRPTIVMQPQPQTTCLGQSATFRVTAVGVEPFSYQWWFGGSPLSGQTSTNLVLTALQSSQAGAYSVVVSNAFGSDTSIPAQLVVNDACVDLRMYAGLNISGLPGQAYVVSYTTDLSKTNSWISLATNIMPASGWFYLDMASPFSAYRFYKVQLKN